MTITSAFQVTSPVTTTTSTNLYTYQSFISPLNNPSPRFQLPIGKTTRVMQPRATVAIPSEPSPTPSPSDEENASAPWMPLPGIVHDITTPEEFDRMLEIAMENKTLLITDFMASWCRKCKYLLPVFNKVAASRENIYFCKVDVNKVKRLPKQHAIRCMPSFLFFIDGKEVDRIVGGTTSQKVTADMQSKIDELLQQQ